MNCFLLCSRRMFTSWEKTLGEKFLSLNCRIYIWTHSESLTINLLAVQSDNAPDFLIFMPAIRQAIWQEVIRVHKSFEMSTCVSALLSLKFQEWKVYPRTNRVIYLEDGFWLRHQVTITDQKLNPGQCLWTKRGLMYCSWFDIHNYFFFCAPHAMPKFVRRPWPRKYETNFTKCSCSAYFIPWFSESGRLSGQVYDGFFR